LVHNGSNRGSVFLIMPACTSSWQTYGCECGPPCLWQSMGLLRRLDVIVLALMLARVIAIVGHAAYRYHSIRRSPATDTNSRKMFAADLSLRLYTLRSIAHTAPFLGLAGSCVGILDSFTGIGMQKSSALAMLNLNLSRAPIKTAAAYLVPFQQYGPTTTSGRCWTCLESKYPGACTGQSVSRNDALESPKISP
jgi:MotA/TolQ/ExbB proton channel family